MNSGWFPHPLKVKTPALLPSYLHCADEPASHRRPIHGADELHRVLVAMLWSLGHRVGLDAPTAAEQANADLHVKE
jgi:hypothetical protein